jgi:hypothetical protein
LAAVAAAAAPPRAVVVDARAHSTYSTRAAQRSLWCIYNDHSYQTNSSPKAVAPPVGSRRSRAGLSSPAMAFVGVMDEMYVN